MLDKSSMIISRNIAIQDRMANGHPQLPSKMHLERKTQENRCPKEYAPSQKLTWKEYQCQQNKVHCVSIMPLGKIQMFHASVCLRCAYTSLHPFYTCCIHFTHVHILTRKNRSAFPQCCQSLRDGYDVFCYCS